MLWQCGRNLERNHTDRENIHTPSRKVPHPEWNIRPWSCWIFSTEEKQHTVVWEKCWRFLLKTTERPKTLHIYPSEPIVIVIKRQDVIKTFQTLFAWQCSTEATAHWAHLTPRWSKAGCLLFPLEGELTNQSNAFSGRPHSVSLRFNHNPRHLPLCLPTLVVKNSLAAVCISSWRMSPSKAGCEGSGDLLQGPRGDFSTSYLARLWCMWRREHCYMVLVFPLRDCYFWRAITVGAHTSGQVFDVFSQFCWMIVL